jgi:predicted nucleotidyltransferase component of viral defense system
MEPQRPSNLHPLTEELLDHLQNHPEASEIVIGGGVALSHYSQHRHTFDLDAWWKSDPKEETIKLIRSVMQQIAQSHGAFEENQWGDVISFNIKESSGQKVFSFQIAQRDQYLELPMTSPWAPILLETFSDNLASKMVALVDRGAPRDLVDIYELVRGDLISLEHCWDLYLQKRPEADPEAAKQQVLEHLERLEARRPLDSITNPEDQSYAGLVRHWYYEHFGDSHGVRL